MMDIKIIEETIEELENGKTNFDSCQKLASLYILKDHMDSGTTSSFSDEYRKYKDQYARGEIVGNDMINHLKEVCAKEKDEIIKTYSMADTEVEKLEFKNMLDELSLVIKT